MLEEFLDNNCAFYNVSESNDSENDEDNYNENIEAVFADVLQNGVSF